MAEFLLTSLVIFIVLLAWVYVEQRYRRFAARHPDRGPYRQQGGCGGACSCSQGSCSVADEQGAGPTVNIDLIAPRRRVRQ